VYARYENPTEDMLNKYKYVPFKKAMINEGRPGSLSDVEADQYYYTCALSIYLYNNLKGEVTSDEFEKPITKSRISIMLMGNDGEIRVAKYRLWMLYIIMGQEFNI
jgi:hypothetical protein